MLFPAISLLLLVLVSSVLSGPDCASLAARGDCSFYDVCIEAVLECGSRGYVKGYGDKYCQRFVDSHYKSSFNQKVIVADTCIVLQHILRDTGAHKRGQRASKSVYSYGDMRSLKCSCKLYVYHNTHDCMKLLYLPQCDIGRLCSGPLEAVTS